MTYNDVKMLYRLLKFLQYWSPEHPSLQGAVTIGGEKRRPMKVQLGCISHL